MGVTSGCSLSPVSAMVEPPHPKSPIHYPDLYGKRRQLAKLHILDREIGFLQEELKSSEGLQPASQCCKEIADFVEAKADPLVPASRKIRSSCRIWKWICAASCFNISWTCSYGCCPNFKLPNCCSCNLCNSHSSTSCSISICKCCSCPPSRCFDKISCRGSCCALQCPSCPDFSGSRRTCFCPKVPLFSCCTKNCCHPCCLCY